MNKILVIYIACMLTVLSFIDVNSILISCFQAEDGARVSDEVVEEALAQLRSMGYQDEGGWLRELVQAKGGDVAKVLDALHPSVEQV